MARSPASLRPSCDTPLVTGCLTGGRRWVLVEHDNGAFDLLVTTTGLPASPADMIDCPEDSEITTYQDLFLSTPWNSQAQIIGFSDLTSWSVYARVLPVTITVNGVSVAMGAGETIGSRAQDGRVLADNVFVQISGAGRAEMFSVRRP